MTITVTCSAAVDVSALLLGANGRVRSDGDFVFFNQPVAPGVVYRHGRGAGDMVDVQTSALPADVDKVAITASLDGSGPATFAAVGSLVATIGSDSGTLTFPMDRLSTEAAVVCVEIYRRGDAWKVRAVGQGYDNGLAGLAAAFGVNIDDEPDTPPQPAAPTQASAPPQSFPPPQPTPPPPYPTSRTAPTEALNPSGPPPTQAFPPPRPHVPGQPSTPGQPFVPGQPYAPAQPPAAGQPLTPGQPFTRGQPVPSQPYPPAATMPNIPAPQGVPSVQSELFQPIHAEVSGFGIQKQGGKMIRVAVNGETLARAGSMVAYQGDLHFKALGSGGIGRAIQQRLTGEGVPLMQVSGRGDLFLANAAADVHTVDLDGTDGLTINGANVLAFDSTLTYNIQRVQGAAGYASNAGFFNCVFTGRGRIAITTHGSPVVLNVDQPTYADPQAAVAWSSSLQTGIKRNDSFGLGRLIGRSTGEGLTLSFSGRGFVIVQPSELPPGGFIGGTGGGQEAGQSGGFLGGILG
ncbi:AIM24 family protein [Nocardia sp. CDC153]|uniref:AIM24 family protein n=1 Tax=Nocardia sp. CDC153 TaxID=3112167 RepID=UPI002DB9425B|nr:AIM24 family protein [Nocardia sp. CDC153]MEC3956913.1 AIM24 family protein [Nocardia sp. CDC153]